VLSGQTFLSSTLGRALVSASAIAMAAALHLAAPLVLPAQAQQARNSILASEMNGFGRLIVTLGKPARAQARSSNGILVVSFDEQISIDLEKLPTQAPGYVSIARRDPDGRTLRFALTRPFRVNLMEAGEKVFIDLLPESWQGLPPPLPADVVEDLARRAREAEENLAKAQRDKEKREPRDLVARVGTGPTFTRLIMDMPLTVGVDITRKAGEVKLGFDAPFRLDVAKLRPQLPSTVQNIETETIGTSLKVTVTMVPGAEVRAFREDDSIIIDWPRGERPRGVEGAENALREQRNRQAAADDAARPAPAAAAPAPAAAPAAAQGAPAAAAPAQRPARVLVAASDTAPPKLAIIAVPGGARISVPFAFTPPAAAFMRGDAAWLVFDTPGTLEAPAIPPDLAPLIRQVEVDRIAGAAVVRLTLTRPLPLAMGADAAGWHATLGAAPVAATEALAVRRAVSDSGRTVLKVRMPEAGRIFWFDDAETGERLGVVSAKPPAHGLAKPQSYVEVGLLPSAHGLLVVPRADDVAVDVGLDEVSIARDRGLNVSLGVADGRSGVAVAQMQDLLLDISTWDEDRRGDTRARMLEFQREAAEASKRDRTEARLRLVRFLMANGLVQEATAVLRVVEVDDEVAAVTKPVMLLRAVAAALRGDLATATRLTNEQVLSLEPEIALWRAVIDAKARRWTPALVGFRQSVEVLERYPDALQSQLRELAALSAIEAGEVGFATQQIDLVERFGGPERNAAMIALMRGRVAERLKRPDDAMASYDAAARTQDRYIEVRARLRRTLLGLDENKLDRTKAIDELETLSVIWRADEVEVEALARLGQLYAEDMRWREAFSTARRANEIMPDHELTRSLHDAMVQRFEQLFLDGKADQLPKVEALGLFYDFRHLTPISRRGDEMIRRLADKLASLDLLDQATELLRHQVDNRLGGMARANVASRLAVLYLLNRKPLEALQVLRATRSATLPEDIRRGRSLLEARALAELSRTDLALEILAGLDGRDVERLRADTLWRGKRWREAGETIERVLGERWRETTPLTDVERADVMRAGVSYVLAGDRLGLDRLRGKFAPRMADSADARAFTLVTSDSGSRQQEFRDLARSIVAGDTLADFLDIYRERYPEAAGPARGKTAAEGAVPAPAPATPAPGAPAAAAQPASAPG
jgi:tetratricopeptide (TPR) repeat protein